MIRSLMYEAVEGIRTMSRDRIDVFKQERTLSGSVMLINELIIN